MKINCHGKDEKFIFIYDNNATEMRIMKYQTSAQ